MPAPDADRPLSAPATPPYGLVALASGAALAYELLLMRLLAIMHWHHFAGIVISLALLGVGCSGTVVSVWQSAMLRRFTLWFYVALGGFAASATGAVHVAQAIPFNALELLWNPRQTVYLVALYTTLSLPFLCAGGAVVLALRRFPDYAARLYAADLAGAGLGAVAVVAALFVWMPMTVLRTLAAAMLLATAASVWRHARRTVGLLLIGAAAAVGWPGAPVPTMSDYKPLQQSLRVPGSRVLDQRSNPLALTAVLDGGRIPLRSAPDLSLLSTASIPPQWGIFQDGEANGTLTRYDGRREALRYVDALPAALPYHLLPAGRPPQVLAIGDPSTVLLQAAYQGVARVTVVDANPQLRALFDEAFASQVGWRFLHPRVRWLTAAPRPFLAGDSAHYDLIQFTVGDSTGGLGERYDTTVEAWSVAWNRLAPQGMFAVTLPLRLPPIAVLKAVATLRRVLVSAGVADPARHVVVLRGTQTAVVVAQRVPWTAAQLARLRQFAQQRAFTPVYAAGLLPEPDHLGLAVQTALQSLHSSAPAGEAFDLRPATDDRPYFFHVFRFATARALLQRRGQGGLALLDWGYPLLLIALLQALLLSVLLMLGPLHALALPPAPGWSRWRQGSYFLLIGLAFMAMELAFIQRFMLLLGQPLYAAATVLACVLLGAGAGSRWAAERAERLGRWPFGVLAGLAVVELLVLQRIGVPLLALGAARWAVGVGLILLLAFWMGVPMPLGLATTAVCTPSWLPWAWAINGCASVVGALLATILALDVGFSGVVLTGVLLYLAAMVVYRPLGAFRAAVG